MANPLRRVLFVDDDQDSLTIAKYALAPLKEIEIKYASSGEEAIKIAKEFHPDLIFLDVMMPKMDGVATFKALKEGMETSTIPVVFFTAKVQQSEIASYIQLGAVDVVTKPFDPIGFPERMKQIWEKLQSKS